MGVGGGPPPSPGHDDHQHTLPLFPQLSAAFAVEQLPPARDPSAQIVAGRGSCLAQRYLSTAATATGGFVGAGEGGLDGNGVGGFVGAFVGGGLVGSAVGLGEGGFVGCGEGGFVGSDVGKDVGGFTGAGLGGGVGGLTGAGVGGGVGDNVAVTPLSDM